MIRSAAKNFQDVAVVVSPDDYNSLAEELRRLEGSLSPETHWRLACKAFRTTADYDRAISARLARIDHPGELPPVLDVRAAKLMDLRYGENPHQAAALYGTAGEGIAGAAQLHGKELSYNNLVDLDAAWQLICEFDRPASAIIKHTNPCGCAEQPSLAESYRKAFEAEVVHIQTWLNEQPTSGRGTALFSCASRGLWQSFAFQVRVENHLAFEPEPDVAPLAALLDDHERYAVALVDKRHARLFTVLMGEIEETDDFKDFVPAKHDQGGLSQANYQRHHEAHVHWHLKRVVQHLATILRRRPFDRLIA